MEQFLESTEIIDWQHPTVFALAQQLAVGKNDKVVIAQSCFEWVRDEIRHSFDFQMNPVTCKASDVLLHQTGYCYAKSHLLAALLRANGIPSGFCYQRLSIDDKGAPFCLHGLNALYLKEFAWYRADARGNKETVDAQFTPPIEKLAFPILLSEEVDFPAILPQPLPVVVEALRSHRTWDDLLENLPDTTPEDTHLNQAEFLLKK